MNENNKIPNSFRDKVLRGEVAATISIKLIRTNEIVMVAKTAGFDGVMIDMEHSTFDLDTTSQLCIAALGIGITPLVRSPSKDAFYISRILDGGALGIIVPHVKTVQDVQNIVETAKFHPIGKRSETGSMPHFHYQPLPPSIANALCNEATLVIPMIETLEALDVVHEIAAVPGVDALFLGSNDLTAEMGIPGDYENKRFTDACENIISACEQNNILVGIGGLQSRLDLVEKLCKMGVRWVSAATDATLFFGAATKKCKDIKELNIRILGKGTI